MRIFKDFKSFNEYIVVTKSLDSNIDIGYYDTQKMRLQSEAVTVDFYRISIKSNFIDKSVSDYNPDNPKPVTAVFFNSPERANGWDVEPAFNGMYLQLSKKMIEENRFLFKNYLDYGEHEALYLTENEEQEIPFCFCSSSTFFNLAFSCYLQLYIFNWASVTVRRNVNPRTSPSCER